jgi:ribosomal protein L24
MKKHVGKRIQIFPGDSQSKWGTIQSIDKDSVEVLIDEVSKVNYHSHLKVGDTMIYPRNKFSYKLA